MQLTLTVLRCPPAVAPEIRTLAGEEYTSKGFTIGRGPGVVWVLNDVNQMVSRRHCTLMFGAGDWQIIDDSANGTFPNHDDKPIGKGNRRALRDHDRLRIGPYEIEVHLAEDAASRPSQAEIYPDRTEAGSVGEDPFGNALWPAHTDSSDDPDANPFDRGDAPARTSGDGPFVYHTQGDDSSALHDEMPPPNAIGQMPVDTGDEVPADDLLPEGCDSALLAGLPGADPAVPEAPPTPATPTQITPAQPQPEWTPRPVESSPLASPSPGLATPGLATPGLTTPGLTTPGLATPGLATPGLATLGDDGLLAAFFTGAGLPDAGPADPTAMMQRLGETYRALVSGLRAVLIARASIKSEFRIEQTMIRTRGNNPLKFSTNDDDAVSALLGVGRHTDMAPAAAVRDALRDVRLHELATMAAMQSAVRALLNRLGPDKVRTSVEQTSGRSLLPNQNKARAWDAYEALHARISLALSDDFDSVFGKAFARAYEEALDDLDARNLE